MMKRISRIVAPVLGVVLCSLVAVPGAWAQPQGPVGVSISPIKFDISADKGETIRRTVTAINPNNFPLKVVPEFQDFRVLEGAGIQWIPSDVENPYRMTDWISIRTDPITLPPMGQLDIPFTIYVPRNASVGGHYAAVFFRAVLDAQGGNIGSIPRVGALIILNVNGKASRSGEITEFSAPFIVGNGPVEFGVNLRNTGTTHFEALATITVRNYLGASTEVPVETGKYLYPGVGRFLKAVWQTNYPVGLLKATITFTDGDGVLHTKSQWIVAFPWKEVLGVIVLLVGLRYLWIYLRRRFRIVRA